MTSELAEEIKRTPGFALKPTYPSVHWLTFPDQWEQKSPWQDRRVRLAANLAIDRQMGTEVLPQITILRGYGTMLPPGSPYALKPEETSQLPGLGGDIEAARAEARQLLEEAGVPNLSFTLLNRSLRHPWEPLGIFLIDQWRQIGVQVTMEAADTAAYFAALNSPVPGTRYSWRNDPVAFLGFPEFFIAHELAHQWWGQAVGWRNYHEQWLSEGVAQYFAALYANHAHGDRAFVDMLRQFRKWAMAESDEGPISLGYRLGHIRGEPRVFRALVYNKGAAVLHMLRRLVGDDSFFRGLRRFYEEHKFKKAGTDDLRRAMEAETGRPLDRFFERLYDLAFQPLDDPEDDDPAASLLRRLAPLFSDDALEALRGDLDLLDFRELEVSEGQVSFEGVVTEADTEAPRALLEIGLRADVVQRGREWPRAELRQSGTLRLQRVGDGWYVEAFDLQLEIEEIPEEDASGGEG